MHPNIEDAGAFSFGLAKMFLDLISKVYSDKTDVPMWWYVVLDKIKFNLCL